MKKQKKYNKETIKSNLASIMLTNMDGLNKKRNKKLHKYLNDKLDDVVNYYVSLLKKKNSNPEEKSIQDEIKIVCMEVNPKSNTEIIIIEEKNHQQYQDVKGETIIS
jgi:hypothetical protein